MRVDQYQIKFPHCTFSAVGTMQGVTPPCPLLLAASFSAQIIQKQIIIRACCLPSLEDLIYPDKRGEAEVLDLK